MQPVTLIFPNTYLLTDFLLPNKLSNVEVSSRELSLSAILTEDEIVKACTCFQAELKTKACFVAEEWN